MKKDKEKVAIPSNQVSDSYKQGSVEGEYTGVTSQSLRIRSVIPTMEVGDEIYPL